MKLFQKFSIGKLKYFCEGLRDNNYQQLVYLSMVEKDLKGDEPQLLQSKFFYLIPELYSFIDRNEYKQILSEIQYKQINHIKIQCADTLFQSDKTPFSEFVNVVVLLQGSELKQYLPILDAKLSNYRILVKDPSECHKISLITLIRFCKSMYYLLKNEQNINIKINYQSLIYQIIINKKERIKITHIYTLLHYTGLIKTNQIIGQLEYKQLAVSVSNCIFDCLQKYDPKEKEFENPELYSKFLVFIIQNSAATYANCHSIERLFLKRAKMMKMQTILSYNRLMFCKLQKYGAGNSVLLNLINSTLNLDENYDPSYLTYFLLSLAQYQAATIMREFKKGGNFDKNELQLLISKPSPLSPLIERTCQEIVNNKGNLFKSLENRHQFNTAIQILQALKIKIQSIEQISELSENNQIIAGESQQQYRYNEINNDTVNYLKTNNIDYEQEKQIGPFVCDYYVKSLNTIIECDGTYHYVMDNGDFVSSSHSRNLYLIEKGYRLILVDWWKQQQARNTSDSQSYLKELFRQLKAQENILLIS